MRSMAEDTSLKKFISNALEDIKTAVPKDDFVAGDVNFIVTVAVKKSKSGKFSINILGADTKKSEITTQKITFSVTSKKSVEENMKALSRFIKEMINATKELERPKKMKKRPSK